MKNTLLEIKKTLCLAAACVAVITMGANAETTELERMETIEFDEFYIANSIKIPSSRKAFIAKAEVAFSGTWLAKFRTETTRSYRRIIKQRYGKALRQELETALESQGWQVSDKANDETITIKPSLVDLNIISPQAFPGRQTILLKNVGSTGVHMDFLMPSGDVLMRIIDADDTIEIVGSPLANRSYNYVYFKMLMTNWANMSAAYLESVVEEVEKQSES